MAQLQDLFQTHAIIKILDYLTLYKDFEYTKTDIANETGISRRTLYQIWPTIERFGLIDVTKSLGKIKFFKLNEKNPITKQLVILADEISFYVADEIAGTKAEKITESNMPINSLSNKPDKDLEITYKTMTIKGNTGQISELFENLDVIKGSHQVPIRESTIFDFIKEDKEESVFRVQSQDGKPVKVVVK